MNEPARYALRAAVWMASLTAAGAPAGARPATTASPAAAAATAPAGDEREQGLARVLADARPTDPAATALTQAACVAGLAAGYPCKDVDLESSLPLSSLGGGSGNDVWGWTDPLTGKEYALVGLNNGTAFVDVSNPASPVFLGRLPTHTANSTWRGIKVYRDHAYVVSEAARHGLQVFDLRRLRAVSAPPVIFTETAYYDGFGHAHTIAVNEDTGFVYAVGSDTCNGGLHMVDVRTPTAPVFAGCFDADGYTHETQCVLYHGPDAARQGHEVCMACNADTLTIVDVTDKTAPVQLSRTDYPNRRYVHQGWLTEDQRYFLEDDEQDETALKSKTRTHLWDLKSLSSPIYMGYYTGPVGAIDHNLYIVGRRAYEANYRSGLRILDLACLAEGSLTEVGYFDIYPADDNANYNGAWSNYPFFKSGIVLVNGIEQGLFVVRPRTAAVAPLADGGGSATMCAGSTVRLDGAASTPCSAAGLRYRWTQGDTEVCPWSASSTCDVAPPASTSFTLEVACAERPGCGDHAGVAVEVIGPPRAEAGRPLTLCLGDTLRLDGSASAPCAPGPTMYRWSEGAAERCGWSPAATCDVTPPASTTYRLEVGCGASLACVDASTVAVDVDPALVPPDLGNSLRAVRAAASVSLSWASHPRARSYALRRYTRKGSVPGPPLRERLATPAHVEPDIPGPPSLYFYRGAGASCAGQVGP